MAEDPVTTKLIPLPLDFFPLTAAAAEVAVSDAIALQKLLHCMQNLILIGYLH